MPRPLVIAYHLIWTAYGCWLANDPRGSGSHTIRKDILAELGELHYGRKRIQPAGRIVRKFYEEAAQRLHYPLLKFDEAQRNEIGLAFGQVIKEQGYTCYACAIMPDHVHILIRKHKHQAEQMMEHLKESSRSRLVGLGHRSQVHPTWTGGHGWIVFLDHPDEVQRTIGYIEQNPVKIDLLMQPWPFVQSYNGWPFHPGHSPYLPYVKK